MPLQIHLCDTDTSEKVLPTVSIITVVYNAVEHIEMTLMSIAGQTWPALEYIIVDGGSSDGTLEIIKKYKHIITKLISEPDEGLYDAMNKGLKEASGDYVWFINAGDTIPTPDTLERAMELGNKSEVVYGEAYLKDNLGRILGTRSALTTRRLPKQLTYKSLKKGMVVCHQSFIIKRTLAPFYDTRYKISSDIDWMIRCLKESRKCVNPGIILSCFLVGGMSSENKMQSLKERFRIFQKHYGLLSTVFIHIHIVFRALFSRKAY